MWSEWRAAIRAGWQFILLGAACFMLGVLSVTPPDPDPPAPVVTITDRSVRQLARALNQVQRDEAPPALVHQADDVLAAVDAGTVTVTPEPEPTTTWQPSPTPTTSATTTTVPPATTTTTRPDPPAHDLLTVPTTTTVAP